jgi:hypothetical protein
MLNDVSFPNLETNRTIYGEKGTFVTIFSRGQPDEPFNSLLVFNGHLLAFTDTIALGLPKHLYLLCQST